MKIYLSRTESERENLIRVFSFKNVGEDKVIDCDSRHFVHLLQASLKNKEHILILNSEINRYKGKEFPYFEVSDQWIFINHVLKNHFSPQKLTGSMGPEQIIIQIASECAAQVQKLKS